MNMNKKNMNMTNGTDMGGMDMKMGGMDMNMKMYFFFSSKAVILFEEWDIDTTGGMVWSCIVVFFMAAFYEGFKVFRELLREKFLVSKQASSSNGHVPGTKDVSFQGRNHFCHWHHFLQSFLHMVQVALSYLLMLIAMTFNGWLFISVCVGAGAGYFLFSWRVSKAFDLNEHCH